MGRKSKAPAAGESFECRLAQLVTRNASEPEPWDITQMLTGLKRLLYEEAEHEGVLQAAWRALWIAVPLQMPKQAIEFLLSHSAAAEPSMQANCSSLFHAAIEARNIEAVSLLLECGVNVNARSRYDLTLLHHAAAMNLPDICKLLLDRGADVNARCQGGFTPVYVATECHCPDVVVLLRRRGAQVDFKPAELDHFPVALARQLAALKKGWPAIPAGTGGRRTGTIVGIDEDTGLPLRTISCAGRGTALQVRAEWVGLEQHIREHGLPWNSRLPWIEIFQRPIDYYLLCRSRNEVRTLESIGERIRSPDGLTILWLSLDKQLLTFDSKHLHQDAPTFGAGSWMTRPRRLKDGSAEVRLPLSCATHRVSLCWGPEESQLVLFQFAPAKNDQPETASVFSVLDLGLGTWIPAKTNRKKVWRLNQGVPSWLPPVDLSPPVQLAPTIPTDLLPNLAYGLLILSVVILSSFWLGTWIGRFPHRDPRLENVPQNPMGRIQHYNDSIRRLESVKSFWDDLPLEEKDKHTGYGSAVTQEHDLAQTNAPAP